MLDEEVMPAIKLEGKEREAAYAEDAEQTAAWIGMKLDERTANLLASISEYINLKILKETQKIIEKGQYKKEEVKKEPENKVEPETELKSKVEFKRDEQPKKEPIRKGGPGGPIVEEAAETPRAISPKRATPKLSVNVAEQGERKEPRETKSPSDEELLRRSNARFIEQQEELTRQRAEKEGLTVEEYNRRLMENMLQKAEERARREGKTVEQMNEEFFQRAREDIAKRAAAAHVTPEQFELQRQKSRERGIIERERKREHKNGKDKSPRSPKKG